VVDRGNLPPPQRLHVLYLEGLDKQVVEPQQREGILEGAELAEGRGLSDALLPLALALQLGDEAACLLQELLVGVLAFGGQGKLLEH